MIVRIVRYDRKTKMICRPAMIGTGKLVGCQNKFDYSANNVQFLVLL